MRPYKFRNCYLRFYFPEHTGRPIIILVIEKGFITLWKQYSNDISRSTNRRRTIFSIAMNYTIDIPLDLGTMVIHAPKNRGDIAKFTKAINEGDILQANAQTSYEQINTNYIPIADFFYRVWITGTQNYTTITQ